MTENIHNIFEQNIQLIKELDTAIFYFRRQQFDKALGITANSVDLIKNSLEAVITDREYFKLVSTDSVSEMLSGILNAQKKKNYILLADLLELQMVNFLCNVQELIINKEEIIFDEERYLETVKMLQDRETGFLGLPMETIDPDILLSNGYRVEFTSCGLMTLAAENGDSQYYFHTNNRIYEEAVILSGHWCREGISKYIIYGFGMGYHISSLSELAPDAEIEVYESDINVVKLACAFNDIKNILADNRIKLIYDPDFTALKNRITGLTGQEAFYIHYPSFQNVRNISGRKLLENYIPWSKSIESC